MSITGANYHWPNATIPYVVAADIPCPARVTDAVSHWNSVMAGTVQMVPRTIESAFVSFTRAASGGTCSSYIGKVFAGQPIQVGDYCSKGNLIHEIGHAWGLWHEHTREDRNSFVSVNLANVVPNQSYNFTQNITNGDDLGAYDYSSIMHYNTTAFSINGLPTIVTIPAGIGIGQRLALSSGDIQAIKMLYPAAAPPPPQGVFVTIRANPTASVVSVDGVTYSTPKSFTWVTGSSHNIAALETWTGMNRSVFARWSDNGARSHDVIASSATTSFAVDYAISYSISAVASPVGTIVASPVVWHSMYPAGSRMVLSAIAPVGYCFAGWTGLIAGTPSSVTLAALRTYNLKANFQTGAITLDATSASASKPGGTYALGVKSNSGCLWLAVSNSDWLKVTSVTSSSGSGSIGYTLAPNASGVTRVGTLSLEGRVLTVTQAGI